MSLEWGCSVSEFLSRVTSEEITELIAFSQIEPFGDEWLQTGTIAAAVLNAAGGRGQGDPFSPMEFVPCLKDDEEDEKRALINEQMERLKRGNC